MTIPAPAFQLPPGIAPAVPPTAAQAPAPEPVMAMDFMAEKYRQLRERKDLIKERHSVELKPYTEAMNQLEAEMQRQLEAQNASSIKTAAGTVIRAVRRSITVADPEAFRQWAEANGQMGMYQNRVSPEAVEAYVEQGHQLPPGLKHTAMTTIQVRKNAA